ncbi:MULTISPECIES: leucyl aminopeptidase [Lysobacteraceae]|uniref:Probable cytosol aminopeptidase n=1 Tax=Novilysobacter avium TaxID=2781023 RepID=A0A7S6ZVQ9_9GAMM|nr:MULTISPECIES: leucyl aminopeptidase [Lysobacter]QOW22439.1 leucyl aminopeptidase [Lysobacter avium]QOW24952.1 leucyl aminopeptidase [Lysobacter sp. H23M47]
MALEFDLNHDELATVKADCIVVGAYADKTLNAAGSALDSATNGRLKSLVERGDASGKIGKTAIVHDLDGVTAARVLIVGLGDADKLDAAQYIKAVDAAARALKTGPVEHAVFAIADARIKGRDGAWAVRQAAIAADHACYTYTATLGEKNKAKAGEPGLRRVSVSVPSGMGDASKALEQGASIAAGVAFARELGNLPPNVCNPAYLADQAVEFAGRSGDTSCEVLEDTDMEKLGMGSLLAVARGSANRPRLIAMKYNGAGDDSKPYVLVGKGLTFDTGGINLKVQGGIEEMKFDMCGGASVMGTFVAVVGMKLKINLVAIVAAVENMPDADAYRPSDVLTSMSGTTIEVGNTDAEGRLVLCDALTWSKKFEPVALVDVATLTGACMVALGKYASGLMTKTDDLAEELLAAGEKTYDRAWRLPLWDEYQTMLESSFADVYNIGGRWGGAITAGCFLSRFTEDQRWAHLDIAGSGSEEGKRGMSTGRPVGLLSQWLIDRAAQ